MIKPTLDPQILNQWIGKSDEVEDTLGLNQAQLMHATLGEIGKANAPSLNTPLPPLWHWAYFLTGAPMSQLGRDGHPALGGFLPPVALPRRMWAGGRITFTNTPQLGQRLTKTSTIKSVAMKEGRSGTLCFVTVEHVLTHGDGREALREEQDIVYREDPAPHAPKPPMAPPPEGSMVSETITPSTVQLFRYSALTFNSHRIHYDRDYCVDVEGYPGIIFHGPLTATLLADFATRMNEDKTLTKFSFRAVSPLFDTEPFSIHHDGKGTLWAQTPEGGLAMKAEAEFE